MNRIPGLRWPLLASFAFLLCALALIPYPGLQNDELFFAGPLYLPDAAFYSLHVGTVKIPLMLMSYSGALKTWVYDLLFRIFEPNLWSVRLPMVLAGIASLWLTWLWVRRFWNSRAAAVTVVLLGTDTMYLLTNIFDWGPVAFQHLFLMGGLAAFQSRRLRPFAFFLWGVGMWDKALLSWPLIALSLAAVCIYPKETLRELRWRTVAIAAAAFTIGAAPLIWYNVQKPGETASANAKFSVEGLGAKASALRRTADGSAMFGYMVYADAGPTHNRPQNLLERIAAVTGDNRTNRMLAGYALAFIAGLSLIGKPAFRPLLFLLLTITIEWLQMALNRGTGGAAHHVILIWPFPLVFLAIAVTEGAARLNRRMIAIGLPAVVGLLVAGNLLNTAGYVRAFALNGAAGGWTDAIYPLSGSLESNSAPLIGLVDWGYLNPLLLLHEGDLPLFLVDPAQPDLLRATNDSTRIFIRHTDDKQMFPGINLRLRAAAGALGYDEEGIRTVRDRHARPVFELFRFVRR